MFVFFFFFFLFFFFFFSSRKAGCSPRKACSQNLSVATHRRRGPALCEVRVPATPGADPGSARGRRGSGQSAMLGAGCGCRCARRGRNARRRCRCRFVRRTSSSTGGRPESNRYGPGTPRHQSEATPDIVRRLRDRRCTRHYTILPVRKRLPEGREKVSPSGSAERPINELAEGLGNRR